MDAHDFRAAFVDYDCSLSNPFMLGALVLGAGLVTPLLVGAWSRLSARFHWLFTGVGLAAVGLVVEGMAFWLLARLYMRFDLGWAESSGASFGCIGGPSPLWQLVLVQVVTSSVFAALILAMRRAGSVSSQRRA